jgi:hypothetical protein
MHRYGMVNYAEEDEEEFNEENYEEEDPYANDFHVSEDDERVIDWHRNNNRKMDEEDE